MNALTAALWKLVCVRELFRLAALEAMVLNTPLARSRVQPESTEACAGWWGSSSSSSSNIRSEVGWSLKYQQA